MPTLLAFHNAPKVKKKYLSRVRAHRKADQIIKGQYWQNGKGCAVGCTLHSANHKAYETELGIPQILARLEDRIFEGLPLEKALAWPEQFLDAAKVGSNLSGVWDKWALWALSDPEYGVLKTAKSDRTKAAVQAVIDLYIRRVAGSEPSVMEWGAARKNAYAYAAAYAAYAAAAAAAATAAYAYAAAAADDAAYAYAAAADAANAAAAAYAYAAAAAAAAAREKFFVAASEKLLELMKEAK